MMLRSPCNVARACRPVSWGRLEAFECVRPPGSQVAVAKLLRTFRHGAAWCRCCGLCANTPQQEEKESDIERCVGCICCVLSVLQRAEPCVGNCVEVVSSDALLLQGWRIGCFPSGRLEDLARRMAGAHSWTGGCRSPSFVPRLRARLGSERRAEQRRITSMAWAHKARSDVFRAMSMPARELVGVVLDPPQRSARQSKGRVCQCWSRGRLDMPGRV